MTRDELKAEISADHMSPDHKEVGRQVYVYAAIDALYDRLAATEACVSAADALRNEVHARVACCMTCVAALSYDAVRAKVSA